MAALQPKPVTGVSGCEACCAAVRRCQYGISSSNTHGPSTYEAKIMTRHAARHQAAASPMSVHSPDGSPHVPSRPQLVVGVPRYPASQVALHTVPGKLLLLQAKLPWAGPEGLVEQTVRKQQGGWHIETKCECKHTLSTDCCW